MEKWDSRRRMGPDLVGEAYPAGFESTPTKWFNTAAFAVPPRYTFGNLGRNVLLGPGFQSWDFGIFKNIPIRENLRLQFRAEFFNAFNNVNFSNPAGILDNLDFGQIRSTVTSQRQIQFGLKLIF